MAQRTIVTVLCDLPHGEETEGTETLTFAFDGTGYEIDVCATHAKDLREKFGTYTEAGRRTGAARRGQATSRRSRKDTADVRAWAREQGLGVSDRGRIPADVQNKYNATH